MLLSRFAVITEIRDDAGLNQNAVGFVQQHPEIGDNVAVKLLEQDQTFPDLDFQCLYRLGKGAAKMFWRHRVNR